jgi:N6-adenosine-specific RNA methylase IME4
MTAAQRALPGLYSCAAMDPPWPERGGGKSTRGAQRHYALMDVPDIIALVAGSDPVSRLAPDAHAWVWVTDNYLRDGLALLDALGFRYVRTLCWVKLRTVKERRGARLRRRLMVGRPLSLVQLRIGLGQYLRGSHELCLLGSRGNAQVPPPARRRPSVVLAPRGRHSAKPAAAYAVMEAVSPGPRVEMFARASRPGWDVWGNEAPLT